MKIKFHLRHDYENECSSWFLTSATHIAVVTHCRAIRDFWIQGPRRKLQQATFSRKKVLWKFCVLKTENYVTFISHLFIFFLPCRSIESVCKIASTLYIQIYRSEARIFLNACREILQDPSDRESFFDLSLSRSRWKFNVARETLVILSFELAALDGEHGRGRLAGEQRFTFVERVFVEFTR